MNTFDKIFSLVAMLLMATLAIVCTVSAICGYWWQGYLAPCCAIFAVMSYFDYKRTKKIEADRWKLNRENK